jgi:xylan 1,4-beta-xylosidase
LPIIIGESDPEGCAACSVRYNPQNDYRNGTMYSSYTAAMFARKHELASRHGVNFEGAVTWAFEFEDQAYFEGFRDLATNGIDKPVLNVFRMFGLMSGDRLTVESSGAAALPGMLESGVKTDPDISATATRNARLINVMIWNYHDDDLSVPDAKINLVVAGMPSGVRRALVRHYRVDTHHSNSYTEWKAMGSPPKPTPEQYARLERAGQLQTLGLPSWSAVENGQVQIDFDLPRQGVSLLQLSWE